MKLHHYAGLLLLSLLAGALFLGAGTAAAATATPSPSATSVAAPSFSPWQAAFYNNKTLTGDPIGYAAYNPLDVNWGLSGGTAGVQADGWSGRFVTYYTIVTAGTYRFTATYDDGARILVNGVTILDDFADGGKRTKTADIVLQPDTYYVEVQYYENIGEALLNVSLAYSSSSTRATATPAPAKTPTPIPGAPATLAAAGTPAPTSVWKADFYSGTELQGYILSTFDTPTIDFDWGGGSPDASIFGLDQWSARFRRSISFPSGVYTFRVTVDDGARLYIDSTLVIDRWQPREVAVFEYNTALSGSHTITLEYFESAANARVRLDYGLQGTLPAPEFPATVVSGAEVGGGGAGGAGSADPVFAAGAFALDQGVYNWVFGGPAFGWLTSTGNGGVNNNYRYSSNVSHTGEDYNWARWFVVVTVGGTYDVQVYIPNHANLTTNARYWVRTSQGYTQVNINQRANAGRWVSLGLFGTNGNGFEFVSLSDVSGEPSGSTFVVYDAVQWIRQ